MIRQAHRPLLVTAASCVLTAAAAAQNAPATTPPPPAPDGLEAALKDGKVKLNVRARLGFADFDNGTDTAFSPTVRTRLGYQTGTVDGFSGYFEIEDVYSVDDEGFNSTQNGNTGNAVIADVEVTEVNQAFINYTAPEKGLFSVKAGRQVIALDDHRFIGHVGWRQDQQTFDAVRLSSSFGVENLEVTGGFIGQVNRIFGEEADFDSESFFVNGSYKLDGGPKVTGFVYGLDFDDSALNSSLTFGGRVAGTHALGDDGSLIYSGSIATQSDFGDNPESYDAFYYAVDLAWKTPTSGTLGVGYEVLGNDGVGEFRTPLATLHKFNGFADVFLATPEDGLNDLYVYYGLPLPKAWKTSGKVIGHFFETDEGDRLGYEIDVVVTKKLTDNITLGGKFAYFDGEDGGPFDRSRLTLDLTYAF